MAENSGIEWTTHTFNPWIGCTKLSPACDNCYAETWDNRFKGERWGPHAARTRTKTWGKPRRWNELAAGAVERPRVFCASLADVFDNHKSIEPTWRTDLWKLIEETPNLDWLLLTKRPQNIKRFVPDWMGVDAWPDNVWIGTTVENQEEAERRIPALLSVPARVRFLSMEPLLGPVDLTPWLWGADSPCDGCPRDADCACGGELRGDLPDEKAPGEISWVIAGGESGPGYRTSDPEWYRSLRDQCADAEIPFLFKQWGGGSQPEIKAKGRKLDGVIHDGYPKARQATPC